MTATHVVLESGTTRDEKTEVSFHVSCAKGIDQPRWSLIDDDFYGRLTTPVLETVSVGPVFHVNPGAVDQASPFGVLIKLEHAVFVAGQSGNPATLYDSTNEGLGLVSVTSDDRDRTRARVTWTGMGFSDRSEGWSRWIVRLYVENEDGTGNPAPIYLGFTCMWSDKRSELQDKLKPRPTSALSSGVTFASIPQADHKLSIKIGIEGEREPCFPDLFKPRDKTKLPDYVYLEPLIVIRESEQLIDLEFTSKDAILFPCDPRDYCSPSMGGREPLALAWLGVTNPKTECQPPENEPVSRGFVGSWIDDGVDTKSAVVRWKEPKDDGVPEKRIASFFFVNQSVIGGGSASASFRYHETLIDPTIVYDKDDPPKGLR